MTRIKAYIVFSFILMIIFSACGERKKTRDPGYEYAANMYEALAPNPQQESGVFEDGKVAQQPPEGTTPLGFERFDFENSMEGYIRAGETLVNPLEVNEENIAEGAALFSSMCSHCHGTQGKGDGAMVKNEKFPAPPSLIDGTSSRGGTMKDLTDGKIYHTIAHGLNLMGPHASQLSPEERWLIVMYIKNELQK